MSDFASNSKLEHTMSEPRVPQLSRLPLNQPIPFETSERLKKRATLAGALENIIHTVATPRSLAHRKSGDIHRDDNLKDDSKDEAVTLEEENREHAKTQMLGIQTVALIIVAVVCLGFIFVYLQPILVPFILSLVLANILGPVVVWFSLPVFRACPGFQARCPLLRNFSIPKWVAVFLSMTLMIGFILLIGLVITANITRFIDNWDENGYNDRARLVLNATVGWLDRKGFSLSDNDEATEDFSVHALPLQSLVLTLITRFFSLSSDLFMVILFSIYLLFGQTNEKPLAAQESSAREQITAIVARHISTYVRWKVIISLVTGLVTAILLVLLDVDLALVFGLLAFVFNFIPNIGSMIALLLPIPVVILDPRMTPLRGVLAIVLPGFVQMVMGNVIEPMLLGDKLDLNEVVVLLSLMLWGSLWGVMGLFLAVPLTSVIVIVAQEIGQKTNHFVFNQAVEWTKNRKRRKTTKAAL